jgi:hypothetical protein
MTTYHLSSGSSDTSALKRIARAFTLGLAATGLMTGLLLLAALFVPQASLVITKLLVW